MSGSTRSSPRQNRNMGTVEVRDQVDGLKFVGEAGLKSIWDGSGSRGAVTAAT